MSRTEEDIASRVDITIRELGKTSKLAETSTFTAPMLKNAQSWARSSETYLKERHFLPGASVGIFVPKSR
jgi:hypothetical protein